MTEENFSLKTIQHWMQNTLLNPGTTKNAAIEQVVKASKRLSAQQHLAIYQRSYVARLRECMAKQFEGLRYALGPELFQQFVDQYLQTYPSSSYTLMDLGKNFARFMEETRPDRDAEIKESWPDFLIELAWFEYHLNVIFDEINDETHLPVTLQTLEEFLKPTPVFHLFAFRYPVNSYYGAFRRGEQPELPFEYASWCAIFRVNFRIAYQGLGYGQYRLLQLWQDNQNLTLTLELLAKESNKSIDEVKSYWQQWRKLWIESGMLSAKSTAIL